VSRKQICIIIAAFRRKNIPEPPRSQIVNFLRRLRTEAYGRSMITDYELIGLRQEKLDMDSLFEVRINKIEIPLEAKNIRLGGKRKRVDHLKRA